MKYYIIVAVSLLFFTFVMPLSTVQAGQVDNFAVLTIAEDSWYNYDGTTSNYDANNVDWPNNMLFTNNATVNKVKNIYWGDAGWQGSTMYFKLNDGSGWVTDTDDGTKSGDILTTYRYHMRIYANSGTSSYNTSLGYYCLGTSHMDINEPFGDYGYSEVAELCMCSTAESAGYSVVQNYGYYGNDIDEWQGDHYYQSNGYASAVNVP
jgi:hypothetical protein